MTNRTAIGIAVILFVGALYLIAVPSNKTVTETVGTGQVNPAATSFTITHNLGKVPESVVLSPKSDTYGKRYWASNITATTFQINLDSPDSGNAISFYWRVSD